MKAILRSTLLVCAAMLFGAGCSSFSHEWKQAAKFPVPAQELQGCWQGVWVSDVTGHTDKLRCVIARKADGTYLARFHAKYRKVLSFGYRVPLHVQRSQDGDSFRGEANLGWMAGGVYHYEGQADATNFHSKYWCKYDHGTFQLARP